MARDALTITKPGGANNNGLVTWQSVVAANDVEAVNDGHTIFIVKKGATGNVEVTAVGVPCSHGRTADEVQSVGTDTTRVFGPYPKAEWNAPDGLIDFDFDSDDNVEMAAISV